MKERNWKEFGTIREEVRINLKLGETVGFSRFGLRG